MNGSGDAIGCLPFGCICKVFEVDNYSNSK